VAGESPDKSEQQKSSGRTSSSERDPRVRVRGDGAAVDQPTAVFKTLPRTTAVPQPSDAPDAEEAAEAADAAPDASGAAEAPETPRSPEAAAAPGPDAPAKAGETAPRDDAPASGDEPASDDGSVTRDEPAAAETRAGAAAPRDGVDDAAAASGGDDADDRDDKAAASGEEPAKAASSGKGAAEDGSEDGDERLRAAVAAWVADDAPKDATASDGKGDAGAEGSATADPRAHADTPAPARTPRAPRSGRGGTPPSAPDPAAGGTEDAQAAEDSEDPRAAKEAQGPKSEPAPKGAEAPEDAQTPKDSEDAQEPKAPKADAPVDQPTAVFTAVPRKAVDQPTTMLKAVTPPKAKPEAAPETARKTASETAPEAEAKSAPEAPAERTSKFVPLRHDDVRPAAQPKPTPKQKPAPVSDSAPKPAPAPAAAAPAEGAAPAGSAAPASLTEAERTKQQPMPPLPPLDLLAELTNTPPPPETPVRTLVRRVKIWTPLVVLLLIVFAVVQAVRPLPTPTLTLTAESSYTFEGGKPSLPWPDQGQGWMTATGLGTVDSFGEQKPVPIASVTKSMTAYIILRDHPLKKGENGPMIEIDAKAEKEGGFDAQGESTLDTVKAGDKISERDAIAAIMIPSANNIARLLARWDAGSEAAFVKKMNATAKELGMTNTTYTDPSGLDATTVSTAEDQVKLGEKLVEIPALVDITKLPQWEDPSGKKWRNWNELVPFDGAIGIKTGSTTKAGGNLLFAAHKKVGDTDQLIVGAVFGQHRTPILGTAIAASKQAMLATQELLESRTVVKKGEVVGHVDNGMGGRTPVIATKDVKVVGWPSLKVELEMSDDGAAPPHTAPAGTKVGTLTVGEGASQVRVPVALESAVDEPGIGDKLIRLS
jgi:D-alanyl-D-alanine carboxypeptidase